MRHWIAGLVVTLAVLQGAPSHGAATPVTFVESSKTLGVAESTETWGIAVTDWDGDRCDDLYVGRHAGAPPRLYRNGCPGLFTDEVDRLRLDLLPRKSTKDRHTPAFGDFNGDGRMDLFIPTGGGGGHGPGNDDQLFRQEADGTFTNIAPDQGMEDTLGSGRFGAWFDYDGDGDLDLFLGHFLQSERPEENRNILWRNRAGNFADAAARAGLDAQETSAAGVATDIDGDGDLDLLTLPGRGASLYLNNGNGTFRATSLRISQVISAAPGDYDGDGDQDLFLSLGRTGRTDQKAIKSILLRNDAGSWTDVTSAAGVGYTYCLSAQWVDVNNDGFLDLFVTRHADDAGVNLPDLLLINHRDGTFRDQAQPAGVAGPTDGNQDSGTWADFNRDGFVDLAVASSKSATSVLVYLNQGNGRHWVTVRLVDHRTKNRDAIGAKVWVTAGGRTLYREITSATARWAQGAFYVHAGLGQATTVKTLAIRWPDGEVTTFSDLRADRHYVIRRPGGLAVLP